MPTIKESVIYAIVNIVNDKIYVGQTVDRKKRWKNHKIGLNYNKRLSRYLQAAWNKHGAENFVFVILERVEPDRELLNVKEQWWIDKLNTANREHGYNLAPSAGSALGVKHTDETKQKWSEQRKGKKRSAEFALSVSLRMTGKIISEETRERLKQSHAGHKHSKETKAKMSESRKGNKYAAGRKQTPEEVIIRRTANLGKKRSPETKAKMSAAQKGRKLSDEHRAKLSEAAKNRWANA